MPLATFLSFSALAFTLGFCLGTLIGSHFVTRQQARRHDELAKRMRELREREQHVENQLRTLREFRQAAQPRADAPD